MRADTVFEFYFITADALPELSWLRPPLTHSPLQPTRSAETWHGSHQRARGPAGWRVDFAAFDRPVNSVRSRGSQSEIMHADAHADTQADTLPGIRAGDTGPCWIFARRNQKHGSSDLQSKARSIWRSVIQDDCLPLFFSCEKKGQKVKCHFFWWWKKTQTHTEAFSISIFLFLFQGLKPRLCLQTMQSPRAAEEKQNKLT